MGSVVVHSWDTCFSMESCLRVTKFKYSRQLQMPRCISPQGGLWKRGQVWRWDTVPISKQIMPGAIVNQTALTSHSLRRDPWRAYRLLPHHHPFLISPCRSRALSELSLHFLVHLLVKSKITPLVLVRSEVVPYIRIWAGYLQSLWRIPSIFWTK